MVGHCINTNAKMFPLLHHPHDATSFPHLLKRVRPASENIVTAKCHGMTGCRESSHRIKRRIASNTQVYAACRSKHGAKDPSEKPCSRDFGVVEYASHVRVTIER